MHAIKVSYVCIFKLSSSHAERKEKKKPEINNIYKMSVISKIINVEMLSLQSLVCI